MSKIIVSVLYIGFLPIAPGTFGSLFGIILGILIQGIGGFPFYLLSIILLFFIGWKSTHTYFLEEKNNTDPPEVVIDEVVGQLVSYLPISFYLWWFNHENRVITDYSWFLVFILFRIFDIWKPWPIDWADNIKSALGVMLDDVVAGLYSAILICGLFLII